MTRLSVNEGFGKEFYRDNSVNRFGPFRESPDARS